MKRTRTGIATLLLGALLVLPGAAMAQGRAEVALRAAMETETVKGDLKGAIAQYEKIAQGTDRAIAARALMRMAECYTKLGDAQAEKVYQRVLRDFADQAESSAEARKRLGALIRPAGGLTAVMLDAGRSEGYDTVSPDGQWIGGTDWIKGDLLLRHIVTGEVKRLVAGAFDKTPDSWAETPRLSPDQKQVAYAWFDDKMHQLRVIPNEPGAKPRVLVSKPGELTNFKASAWSPDGKFILLSTEIPDKLGPPGRGSFRIAWVSVADGSIRSIKTLEWWMNGGRPLNSVHMSLSPDGKYIVYSKQLRENSPDKGIYALSADGATESELVVGDVNEEPVWAPDGTHVLFSSNRSGTFGLWAVPVREGKRTGAPAIVKGETGRIAAIGISRSGRYFYTYRAGVGQVFIAQMEQAGGRATTGKPVESFVGTAPAWSRDGKWLAYKRSNPASGGRNFELHLHAMETGRDWTFDPKGMAGAPPLWYADGNVQPIGNSTLRVNVNGAEPKEGNANFALPIMGVLSHDDKWLYRLSPEGVEVIDVATAERRQTLAVKGTVNSVGLSPDGRSLAVGITDASNIRISQMSIDGSGLREIYSGGGRLTSPRLTWTRDGRSILFVQTAEEGAWRIMRIAVAGGQPEFTGISGDRLGPFDLSPDGSRIAYVAGPSQNQVWALDGILSALK